MKYLATIVALAAFLSLTPSATAQTTGSTVTYAAGWNMAGGPTGTSFAPAAYFYSWQNGAYVDVTSRAATACQGYWAYFNNPTSVVLPATQPVATQACPLLTGWNLIGNPFGVDAVLPAGVTAYHWNPQRSAYDIVSSLHPGEAVWVYGDTPGALTLTASPPPTAQPPPTRIINALSGPGPYQVHVGDTISVTVPYLVSATVTADSRYLTLVDAGNQIELTCLGDPLCQMNPTVRFWSYRAVAAGVTYLTVAPACVPQTVACGGPIQTIELDILP